MGQTEAAARVLSTGPQDTQTYGLRASMLAKEKQAASLEAVSYTHLTLPTKA
uniref:Uncharacterized protein n=1 Tax=Ralstonia solanacearum TaxID=305 RepID=A0A0S4VC81_RALSL|nr:protein of unknown function [Ralstonia solanacearum]